MKTLKLVLKKKWYDMIASGEKKAEYRELTAYWEKRLWVLEHGRYSPKEFDAVTFYLGYSKNRPSMTYRWKTTICGTGKQEWGAQDGKFYNIILFGERIDNAS